MIYFLLGFFMAVLIWPACSSLEQLLEQLFEYWKTLIIKKMYDIQKDMQADQEDEQEPEKHYGFGVLPYPEEMGNDDEEQQGED